jgi:hypothetical protein
MISSAVSSSPVLQIAGTVNTGTAGTLNSAADVWSIQNVIGSVAPNPTSFLTFTHTGSSGVAAVSAAQFYASGAGFALSSAGAGTQGISGSGSSTVIKANTGGSIFLQNAGGTTFFSCVSGSAAVPGALQVGGATVEASGTINVATGYYVNGIAGVTQSAEAVGTLATTGGIVTTFTAVSDERLKVFESTRYGLDEILQIVPIKYRWNEIGQRYSGQSMERDFIGFSAQNVERIIPEAVWVSKDGYLGFDDRPVIAALVNAVKTLEARIRELEK